MKCFFERLVLERKWPVSLPSFIAAVATGKIFPVAQRARGEFSRSTSVGLVKEFAFLPFRVLSRNLTVVNANAW